MIASRPMSGSKAYSERRRLAAHPPEPGLERAGRVRFLTGGGESRAADRLRDGEELEEDGVRQPALAHRQPLVEAQSAVEHPLRPTPPFTARLQRGRLRDADQRLLGEPELLGLVPALEAEPAVPVQVTGVRPVARHRAPDPAPDEPPAGARQRPHPGVACLPVEAQERQDDIRVLGRVEIRAGVRARARVVVEAQPGAEVGPEHEAEELRVQVVAQQRGVARHGRVGREISAYQLIWLSRIDGQRQKRERATRWMWSAIKPPRVVRKPECLARPPRMDESVDDLGVEHDVLRGGCAGHGARHPGAWGCDPGPGSLPGVQRTPAPTPAPWRRAARGGRCATARCGPAARRRCA